MSTDTKPISTLTGRGWPGLSCLNCGAEDTVRINLDCLDEVHCSECEVDQSVDYIRDQLAAWQSVLVWIALAPPAKQ